MCQNDQKWRFLRVGVGKNCFWGFFKHFEGSPKKVKKIRFFEGGSLFSVVEHGRRIFQKIVIFGYVHFGRVRIGPKPRGARSVRLKILKEQHLGILKPCQDPLGTLYLRFYGYLSVCYGWWKRVKMAILEGPKNDHYGPKFEAECSCSEI